MGRGLVAVTLGVFAASPAAAQATGDPSAANGLFRLFVDSKHVLVRSLVQDYSMPVAG
jgi:hypothetical protein